VAALYVVINHVFLRAFPGYPVDHAPFWAGWFIYGRFAVVVFIVLSGFSLALSPARHGWRLDGIHKFAQRRAWRILPAYWAALVFSLAVAWLIVPQPGHGMPDAKSFVVNGLLVQNLAAAHSPNAAFWSMAVEAQLYIAFPLLLLMVRRCGAASMVITVTLIVAVVGVVGPHVSGLDTFVIQSPPELAALFALGVVTAGIAGASRALRSWPWTWLALAAALPVLATIWWQGSVWTIHHLFWVDLALGPAIACLLAGLATGRPARLLRLLDTRPFRRLGSSSYSLYLTHAPIVVIVYERIVAGRVPQGVPAFVVTLAIALPLTIVLARLFALVFEEPFLRHRRALASPRLRPARAEWAPVLRTLWAGGRVVGPAVVLGLLVWRVGTSPFLDGLRTIDGPALAAAAGLAALTTVCCAWRWKVVAGGLAVKLSLSAAVAAYYRSLFLNLTLPGGIVGDVHRGVSHGRDVDDVSRALRAVAWERFAGQVVQVLLTVVVLLAFPSPVRLSMPLVVGAVVVAGLGFVLIARAQTNGARSAWARVRAAAAGDIRDGLLARTAWPRIALASAFVVCGHVLTFLIAARVAGASVPPSHMVPIALLVLLAGVLPSIGGWGPREGVTAWVFGAAGLGAGQGVATAVVYGVMVLVGSLPGAAVLVVAWFRSTQLPGRAEPLLREEAAHA
jgi:peptidoglycan/LPS O-acetylase OafA/YrhL